MGRGDACSSKAPRDTSTAPRSNSFGLGRSPAAVARRSSGGPQPAPRVRSGLWPGAQSSCRVAAEG
eukprot:5887479-Alexandrium_andersonii.AAC.1